MTHRIRIRWTVNGFIVREQIWELELDAGFVFTEKIPAHVWDGIVRPNKDWNYGQVEVTMERIKDETP